MRNARAGGTEDAPPAPNVVATYYPLYVIALNVMKDLEPQPELLMEPAGGCAHGLSPRPSQVASLHRADVIVETGLGLEPFLDSERLPWNRGALRIPVARDIPENDLIALAHDHARHGDPPAVAPAGTRHGGDEHEHADHGHDDAHARDHGHGHEEEASPIEAAGREGFNGHAWSSPRLAARMTLTLGEALAAHDPPNADRYRANAAAYAERLQQLHEQLVSAAAPLGPVRVVVSHTSLAYLVRELNGVEAASLRDEDENEPGPRGFGRLLDQVRASGLDAVLFDPQDDGRLALAFAREIDCERVIRLDPAASGELDAEGYVRIMKENIRAIKSWAGPGPGRGLDDAIDFEPLASLEKFGSAEIGAVSRKREGFLP
jgi:ABC-type Zn uptake system ZnuABC Zn-binding protein ZnuA